MNKFRFALDAFRVAREKGLMNGRVLIALVAASVLVLIVWAGFAALGYLWRQAPAVIEGGRGLATETARRVDETLPGVKEKIEQTATALSERARQLWPGEAVPGQDVGGEDLAGVPRFPGMVRVAFGVQEQKRSVAYKGEAGFTEVVSFYTREMPARGFTGQVTAASPTEETHVYTGGNRRVALKFVKTSRLGREMTEVEVREL